MSVLHERMMTGSRLLVINPNSNVEITDRVRRAALASASPHTELTVTNPMGAPLAIESLMEKAEAIPLVAGMVEASVGAGYDGYVMACFDDIGVAEARALVSVPVISMAEAGMRAAAAKHRRFTIVTTVEEAVPNIAALAAEYGLAERCSIRAAGIGVSEAAAQSASAERRLREAIFQARFTDDATAIVLGSGAYSGRAAMLQQQLGICVIDGLEAAIAYCERRQMRL